ADRSPRRSRLLPSFWLRRGVPARSRRPRSGVGFALPGAHAHRLPAIGGRRVSLRNSVCGPLVVQSCRHTFVRLRCAAWEPPAMTAEDMVDEARRIIDAAAEEKVPLRLIGGVAIRLHSDGLPPALQRPYQDIDLVTTGKGGRSAVKLLSALGYTPNDRFNAMNAGRRAVVYDVERERQIDVFVGEFHMCHKIDIAGRLDVDNPTIPLAELLLTKLQIVQLNRKDIVDIAAILYEHEVGES